MWVLIVVPVLSFMIVIVLIGMVLIVYHCVDYPGNARATCTPQEMSRFRNAPQIQPISINQPLSINSASQNQTNQTLPDEDIEMYSEEDIEIMTL